MKLIIKSILTCFLFIALFQSCETEVDGVNQGIIAYDISYPRPFEDKWMEKLMPKDMEMQFKNNKVNSELTFGLGMIRIGYIHDSNSKQLHEMLKFMKKRNFSNRSVAEVQELLADIPHHEITLLPDTKSVAGFLCKKALVEVDSPNGRYTYDLWYTEQIKIKDPNWCTPFHEIPGVLMEYQVERFNVIMRFVAKEVRTVEINDLEFQIPPKYTEIPYKEMEKSIEELKDI